MNNIDYKLIIEEIKILEILFNYIDRFERKWFISKIVVNILDCHRRKLNNER